MSSSGAASGGVAVDAALPAGPSGWTLVPDAPDLEGTGTARLIEIPLADDNGFATILQCRFEDDDFPRFVFCSDGSLFLGDGTVNPLQTSLFAGGLIPNSGSLALLQNGIGVQLNGVVTRVDDPQLRGTITFDGGHIDEDAVFGLPLIGPIVVTPDESATYRLGVNNAGAVIATIQP